MFFLKLFEKSFTKNFLVLEGHHKVARVTGLEPATSGVTGRRSNQLSYTRIRCNPVGWQPFGERANNRLAPSWQQGRRKKTP